MQIEISAQLFARVQAHAVPIVDSFESVVTRAFDAFEKSGSAPKTDMSVPFPAEAEQFNPWSPPTLTHTVVDSVELDGIRLPRSDCYWNRVMRILMDREVRNGYTGERLLDLFVVPAILGVKTDEGYSYYPEAKISLQGQDSIGAWRQIAAFCKHLQASLQVKFHWSDNPKSPYPGKHGVLGL